MYNLTFKKSVENAASLLALGQREIYLSSEVTPDAYPWSLTTSIDPGSTYRLDMVISVWFSCDHECGLRFRWSFDIESRRANGKGGYEIETNSCREVMRKLSEPMRSAFREFLLEYAQKVGAKGAEYQAIADRQMRDAATLRDIASA